LREENDRLTEITKIFTRKSQLNKEKKEQAKTIQALQDEIKKMEDMWKEMNPNDYSEGERRVLISNETAPKNSKYDYSDSEKILQSQMILNQKLKIIHSIQNMKFQSQMKMKPNFK
jgi:hypothetical protein